MAVALNPAKTSVTIVIQTNCLKYLMIDFSCGHDNALPSLASMAKYAGASIPPQHICWLQ